MSEQTQMQNMGWFSRLAHPGAFMQWSAYFIWPLIGITVTLFATGLWFAFFNSPADYQMGETVRIMYVHVPNAWLSQLCYGLMAASAIGTLVWRHPMADVSLKTAAPLGAAFTAMALITGALWGRPTWGTFWEWDGRMTSTLILFLIYLALIALWRTMEDQLRAAKIVAVLALIGAINIPIIKFSVDWWNTLHQPTSVLRPDGPTMPPEILTPLFLMFFAFTFLFALLHLVGMRTEVQNRRIARMQRQALKPSGAARVEIEND